MMLARIVRSLMGSPPSYATGGAEIDIMLTGVLGTISLSLFVVAIIVFSMFFYYSGNKAAGYWALGICLVDWVATLALSIMYWKKFNSGKTKVKVVED